MALVRKQNCSFIKKISRKQVGKTKQFIGWKLNDKYGRKLCWCQWRRWHEYDLIIFIKFREIKYDLILNINWIKRFELIIRLFN